jgi:uncharacterized membrane protein
MRPVACKETAPHWLSAVSERGNHGDDSDLRFYEDSLDPKLLHVALWTAQCLLAAAFLLAATAKLTTPIDQLAAKMPWVTGAMGSLVHVIGVCELLGALGLVLPSLTRVKPGLTVLAALGLGTIMVLALATHLSRGEVAMLPVNLVLVVWPHSSPGAVRRKRRSVHADSPTPKRSNL